MKPSNTDFKPFGLLRKLALASCLVGASLSAHADLDDIKAKGVMTVATEDDYAPFNFIVDGKPEGFHKELLEDLKAYAKAQGFDVKQEILPWTGLLASVSSGQYDMAFTGALVTDDRLRVFNFAPPFASAQHFYVKRAGDDSLSDIASLCGKTVGLQAGSALLARLPELKKMMEAEGCKIGKVTEYPSYPEAYADLANGRLDYVINALISVNDLVKTRGDTFAKGIAVSGDGFAAWPVPKSSPELLEFLTGFMTEVRDSGRLAELQSKWFGEAFPAMPKEPITTVEQFHELAGM
ncbi:polar amino acid transport system substrate-binding protein [Ectopseudomonas composti]|uniref:Polar amino acid transport system substrate-binding protein n=1 Tax=Ectopseudomonas composti TaxID=658457 RepID=A0A1I5JFT4_9GAMM|nr:transporter substrate-binding domain-containing protein [Pseudomonas composti]SFO71632.1 polar amino acid transport system substrate-binding protein [Pseudomonas composti]